nr:uncharacterized protein LOC127320819 [Lolium perenne]
MQQMMTAQAQLMQMMTQFMANNNNNNPPQQDRLTRFLRLNPPTFSSTSEPIAADDWLRTTNKKLDTVQAQGAERVRLAAHQLEGAFRTAHVAAGAMTLKRREFRDLREGTRTVSEYGDLFNKLARYAPDDVATDAKRQDEFMRGLNDEISIQLVAIRFNSYQELLDRAVVVESKHKSMENRKRKHNHNGYNQGPPQRTRTFHDGNGHNSGHHRNGGNGHNFRGSNGHQHNGGDGQRRNGNGGNNHARGLGNNSGGNGHNRNGNHNGKKDISLVECYKCRKLGHYADNCPENKVDGGTKPNSNQKATVHHVNVEEVQDEPDLVTGKFLINSCIALVLFDTGASHSFISRAFVDKNRLPTEYLRGSIRVCSPGGEMIASAGCRNFVLEIGAYGFSVNLIVLDSQGLDVILGMDWMSKHEGQIDCAQRSIMLRTPEGKRIRYRSLAKFGRAKLNSLKGVSLDEVRIVREYPDVFPEELPGMPPDRDVEFLIDLMPGTGPIAKRPYKMDVEELKELKKCKPQE